MEVFFMVKKKKNIVLFIESTHNEIISVLFITL